MMMLRASSAASRVLVQVPRDQVRHASFSLAGLRSMLGMQRNNRRRTDDDDDDRDHSTPLASGSNDDKTSLFDDVPEVQVEAREKATYHKSSTAHFKTSRRKLNDLANLIAGRSADEGILQLEMSRKKQAPRLLSMLALARNHAMAKGLDRSKLVVAQSWVTKGKYLPRIDIKGRGRFGKKHHPSAKLHVLLAEGKTEEERRRLHEREKYRRMIRGQAELDGDVGVGKRKPLINTSVAGWRW